MVTEGRVRSTWQRVVAMAVVVIALLSTWGLATATAVPVEGGRPSTPGRPASPRMSLAVSATPVPQIEAMLSAVVSTTLSQTVGDLSGEWPVLIGGEWYTITTRYTYDPNDLLEKAVDYAGERLAELGLEVEYHYWNVSLAPNVIGELAGALTPEEVVILSAHLDSYNRYSSALAPGADDDASGVAAVLAAAEILSEHAWGRTLRFALWTGEEQGALGSKEYAQRSAELGEEIVAVVNLDMIGWDGLEGPDMDLHARQTVTGSLELAGLFSDVVGLYDLDLVPEIVAEGTSRSDHASFWEEGYAAILGIEDFSPNYHDFNPYYHTAEDRLVYLDMGYLTELARAAVGTVAHLGCLVENGLCRWRLYVPLVVREYVPAFDLTGRRISARM